MPHVPHLSGLAIRSNATQLSDVVGQLGALMLDHPYHFLDNVGAGAG